MAWGRRGTRFTCTSCGETHEGPPDLTFAAPYYYYAVPEPERDRRCALSSDFCSIDAADFFIRGCLEIPVVGTSEAFSWGVWSSVGRVNFERYQQVFREARQSHVGPFFGWFASRLPGYPDTLLLKVMAHLRDDELRPSFELEQSDHPLAIEYRRGIATRRLQELYEARLHGSAA